MKSFISKRAFTLAEVLITLVIIGVVAAITIPSINNNINNQKLVVALKKDFSTLSQATQMIVADNGGSLKGLCFDNDSDCLRDVYSKYIKDIKSCNSGFALGNCWHANSGLNVAYWLNGSKITSWTASLAVSSSINGGFIRFGDAYNSCNGNSLGGLYKSNIVCGLIAVDVNGFVLPNTVGRDIFYFSILENRIIPYGTDLDNATCNKNTDGYGCAAKVLTEGAMNY